MISSSKLSTRKNRWPNSGPWPCASASQGYEREALLGKFEEVRQQLRREDREADEDAVMDVLDFRHRMVQSSHENAPQPEVRSIDRVAWRKIGTVQLPRSSAGCLR